MANILLALFLILFGLNMLFGLSLPLWLLGVLALAAGVAVLATCFGVTVKRK